MRQSWGLCSSRSRWIGAKCYPSRHFAMNIWLIWPDNSEKRTQRRDLPDKYKGDKPILCMVETADVTIQRTSLNHKTLLVSKTSEGVNSWNTSKWHKMTVPWLFGFSLLPGVRSLHSRGICLCVEGKMQSGGALHFARALAESWSVVVSKPRSQQWHQ